VESIISSVLMTAWPLYAEHKMNVALLAELRVAVCPKIAPTKGVVGREEIEMMIRKVMEDHEEGKAMRARIKELKNSGEKAWAKGGFSFNALSQIAKQCKMNLQH